MSATVLVVDDDAQVRRLVATVLERSGYRVLAAASKAEASAVAEAQRQVLALVVSDVELPDGSGLDLVRELAPSKIPVVVLSSQPVESEARAAGAAAFLAKPFEVAEFLRLVRSLLESSGPSATAREGERGGEIGRRGENESGSEPVELQRAETRLPDMIREADLGRADVLSDVQGELRDRLRHRADGVANLLAEFVREPIPQEPQLRPKPVAGFVGRSSRPIVRHLMDLLSRRVRSVDAKNATGPGGPRYDFQDFAEIGPVRRRGREGKRGSYREEKNVSRAGPGGRGLARKESGRIDGKAPRLRADGEKRKGRAPRPRGALRTQEPSHRLRSTSTIISSRRDFRRTLFLPQPLFHRSQPR